MNVNGRTPCGVRGLKQCLCLIKKIAKVSHPVWGAWIETALQRVFAPLPQSHPVWGAWIETFASVASENTKDVAPRVGCVD